MKWCAMTRVAAMCIAVMGAAATGFDRAEAAWTTPDCRYIITYFYLPAGEYLNAYVCQDFEDTSLQAGILTDVYSSNSSVPEMYAQANAYDTCAGGAYQLYAYADNTVYNASTFQTPHGTGYYRDCQDRHGYKNYGEAWGVDPPPTWHAQTGQWCDNAYVPCS